MSLARFRAARVVRVVARLVRAAGSVVVPAALGSAVALGSACDKRSAAADQAPLAPGELRVTANEHGFSPPSLALPKGTAGSLATVTFLRTTDQTCATEVVFPELDLKKTLPLNQPVAVQVPNDAARTLSFQCGMGMYKGALVVH
jgi:plastocyanin domain-containing protein